MSAISLENALSPKPQPSSRAPSPVPSAVYPSTNESMHGSSPRLPQPRRSSFSTEADVYEDKSLTSQRSYPYLGKKNRKQKPSRRGSDATDGSEGSSSIAAAESIALAAPRLLANDKRNNDFHTLFRSVPDGERLIDGKKFLVFFFFFFVNFLNFFIFIFITIDYGCALQKEILLQGRVYISEHHLCFNANIFGWITNVSCQWLHK